METNPIETWWPRVSTRAKEWLRENPGSKDIPDVVVQAIRDAGGPADHGMASVILSPRDWQFVEIQSEFVD